MKEDRFEGLTEAQRTCLRLVARGLSSKEIARETDLSPQTVDQYLSKASALIGVASRREAARQFQSYEQFRKAEFKPTEVVEDVDWDMLAPSEDEGWQAPQSSMHDSASGGLMRQGPARRSGLFPPMGGETNDLKSSKRIYAALRIALFSAIVMVAIVTIITGALSLFG